MPVVSAGCGHQPLATSPRGGLRGPHRGVARGGRPRVHSPRGRGSCRPLQVLPPSRTGARARGLPVRVGAAGNGGAGGTRGSPRRGVRGTGVHGRPRPSRKPRPRKPRPAQARPAASSRSQRRSCGAK